MGSMMSHTLMRDGTRAMGARWSGRARHAEAAFAPRRRRRQMIIYVAQPFRWRWRITGSAPHALAAAACALTPRIELI